MSRIVFSNPFSRSAEKAGQLGGEDTGGRVADATVSKNLATTPSQDYPASHGDSWSSVEQRVNDKDVIGPTQQTGRVRKLSMMLRKHVRAPKPLLQKVVGFLKPVSSSEARRNQLRDLLQQNSGPIPLGPTRPPAVASSRSPRPASIDADLLDLINRFPSPTATAFRRNAAKKVAVVPGRVAKESIRHFVTHSSPAEADALQYPPANARRGAGSLPTIPNVRQKLGVAPDPCGRVRQKKKDPDLTSTHIEVLQRRRLRIPLPSFTKWMSVGVMGQGGFGTVYRVLNVVRSEQCAMKIVHFAGGMSGAGCNGIINELKVLGRLAEEVNPSPFLLRPFLGDALWAWQSAGKYLHIVTELCTGGDLSKYKYSLTESSLSLVCAEVILGLNHLHRLGIIHHDLKPTNILVDAEGHCVIADFGGAQFLNASGCISHSQLHTAIVTPQFAAPELLSEDASKYPAYDEAVDYWSLGATLVSLLMEDSYLPGSEGVSSMESRLCMIEENMRRENVSTRPQDVSKCLRDFVMALLNMEASERPRYPEIGAYSFLQDVNWVKVEDLKLPPFPIVQQLGAKARGFEIAMAPVDEISKLEPVDFLARLRQEQLSLVVDDSYDVEWHNASIQGPF